jgi:hypothetical protein
MSGSWRTSDHTGGGSRNRQSDVAERFGVEPQIDTGTLKTAVSQQVTDRLDTHATLEQTHRKSMSQSIGGMTGQWQIRILYSTAENLSNASSHHGPLRRKDAYKNFQTSCARPPELKISTQNPHRLRAHRQRQHLASLVLWNVQQPASEV